MRPRKPVEDNPDNDRDFVVALARGLEILRAFRREGDALGNKDFAERTGLSKSTVSRLTYTLHRLGYLSFDANTVKYQLATPVLSLGFSCLAGMGVRQLAKPFMQELADYAGMPVALAGRDRLTMVYLERCKSQSAITLVIEVGAHIKLATTALGRAYIAAIPEAERVSLLAEIEKREGENWPAIRTGIEEALQSYRTHGYTTSIEEWKSDVNGVAVPYVPRDGGPVLAFNCGGSAAVLTKERIASDIGPRLVELVRRVSTISQ